MISLMSWIIVLLLFCFVLLVMCAYYLSRIDIGIITILQIKHHEESQKTNRLIQLLQKGNKK
jgi:hypothetical protein